MARIELKDWPTPLENSGETVLETMIANGVPFPFSCASGDCGACKGRVLCGEVVHDTAPEGILSAAERADGYVLACRCTPKNDLRLEALDELVELPAARRQRGWVVAQEKRQGDVIVLRIAPTNPVKFLAGQFFYLKFDNLPQRAYSVASLPGAEELEFHIRVVEGGKTSNYVNRDDLVGSEVTVDGPYGHGYWRQNHEGPIVAIAGGTGLAPMLSVIGAALRENARRNIHLYYAAREEADVYFEAELQALVRQYPKLQVTCSL
ncbi:MAG: 2Fe-2S iron-sulfur cluster binding domain-containing protein, partial [Pseudogulbenkiania sp.]|nr:2Fe-2S iron-sulfur cluster binding domain-containing protein [Pseudogulbenkiania sp.]